MSLLLNLDEIFPKEPRMNLDETNAARLVLLQAKEYVAALDAVKARQPPDDAGDTEGAAD